MTAAAAGSTAADWSELFELATFQGGFNATIVTVGTTMLGVAAGVIGVFALLRRRALVADALSHATLPGIAIAFIVSIALGGDGRSLPVLLFGAATSGVIGILAIQSIGRWTRLREDAAIAIVLSVFFGVGIVALSWIQANEPSSSAGLGHFIYGRTASMLPRDAWTMVLLAIVVVTLTAMLRREFGLTCFDRSFALANGVPTGLVDIAMLGLVVLVTVAGLQAVGGNIYTPTYASGDPEISEANQSGYGAIKQYNLETSNAEAVTELVSLIKTQRAFEMNSQVIQAANETLQEIVNLRRF